MTRTVFLDGHSYIFSRRFPFDTKDKPMVELLLRARDGTWVSFLVVADTGADATLMPASHAPALGIADVCYACVEQRKLRCPGTEVVTAFFHRIRATIRGSGIEFLLLVGFSPEIDTPLFGRPDMLAEFPVAFDSKATYFMRD